MAGKWVMFDLETLGLGARSVIVSIGACRFDVENEPTDTMALLLDMEEQQKNGRKIDLGTVTWWMEQSDEARAWNFNKHNRYGVEVALSAFSTFCQGAELFWCRGTNFDSVLLENLMLSYGVKPPWGYNKVRDVRTLDELDEGDPMSPDAFVAHKPLDDCLVQVAQVRRVFKRVGMSTDLRVGNGIPAPTERLVPRRVED